MTPPAAWASLAPWQRAAASTFAVMALAQIAVPLTADDRLLTGVVIVGFALTTLLLVAHQWGIARAWRTLAVVAVLTLALERVGSTTGFPFGDYEYTGELRPAIGGVPVIVPLAWFAMGVPALAVARCIVSHRVGAVVVGAAALTAWDLFLDPQMVDEGYWVWAVDGWYRGIPWSNYLGWLGAAVIILAIVDQLLPNTEPPTPVLVEVSTVSDREKLYKNGGLVALYTWWAVMNTVGFVAFFGDPFVGVVGGVAMGVFVVLAWRPVVLGRG